MRAKQYVLTLCIGVIGGLFFALLHLPLPWILGPAAAVMTMNAVKPGSAQWPDAASQFGFVVIAFVLGHYITRDTAWLIVLDLPWMIIIGLVWIILCFAIGIVMSKAMRLSEESGVLGCMPGGLSQMVLLADQIKGADPGTVAIIQTTRLILVLYTVPFLATLFANSGDYAPVLPLYGGTSEAGAANWPTWVGYALLPLVPLANVAARKIGIPAGEFIGPALLTGTLSALGCPWPPVPDLLMAIAQISIGIYIGGRVQPRLLVSNKRLAPLSFLAGALLVGVSALAAWLLSAFGSTSIVSWFLALGPGGLGEMAATALALQADVAKVTTYQTARLFMILLAAPPILRLLLKGRRRWQDRH